MIVEFNEVKLRLHDSRVIKHSTETKKHVKSGWQHTNAIRIVELLWKT